MSRGERDDLAKGFHAHGRQGRCPCWGRVAIGSPHEDCRIAAEARDEEPPSSDRPWWKPDSGIHEHDPLVMQPAAPDNSIVSCREVMWCEYHDVAATVPEDGLKAGDERRSAFAPLAAGDRDHPVACLPGGFEFIGECVPLAAGRCEQADDKRV